MKAKTLLTIFGASALASGLFFGTRSCEKHYQHKQEQKTEQRMEIYKKFMECSKDTERLQKKIVSGEVLENCLQDLVHADRFNTSYIQSEKEYMAFMGVMTVFNDTVVNPNGDLQAATAYLGNVTRYMQKLEDAKKKPIDTFNRISIGINYDLDCIRGDTSALPEFAVQKTKEYQGFFDSVESTVHADIAFLDQLVAYASKRTDEDAVYAKKIAAEMKKKRRAILNKVGYHKEMLESNSKALESYFSGGQEPEEEESKLVSGEF